MARPAIVVLTHSREQYLRPTLQALLRLSGINEFTVYVSCDDSPNREQLLKAAGELGIPATHHWRATPASSQYASAPLAKIAHHFKYVFEQAFTNYGHSHLILLEDDLVPAPDFLSLFRSTAHLLDQDPTLWCVSAWNDNGLKQVASDLEALYRTDYFPGLGWMLKKSLWDELRLKWPESPSTGWDHWMRLSEQHKGRECVFPEVPRTQHIGVEGTNIHEAPGQSMADIYAFASRGPIPFPNTQRLGQPQYETWVAQQIKSSPRIPVQRAGQAVGGGVVLYTAEEYYSLQTQLGLRVDSPRGTYRGVIPLRRPGGLLFLADVRISKQIAPNEQVRPAPGLLHMAANPGETCNARCQRGKGGVRMQCEMTQFAFLNTCEALKRVFPCERGCGHQTGPDIPNYVTNPQQPTYQQCLISDGGAECAASHPDTRRLCPCV